MGTVSFTLPSEFGTDVLVDAVTDVERHGAPLQRGGRALPCLMPVAGVQEPAGGVPLSAESPLNVPWLYLLVACRSQLNPG